MSIRFKFKHRPIFLTYGAFLLIWVAATIAFRISSLQPEDQGHRDRFLPMEAPSSPDSEVLLGVFVDNIYLFKADDKTFDANGWIWLQWSVSVQRQLVEKQLSPEKLIVIGNLIDSWDFALTPADEGLIRRADGRYYQRFQFSGHFYVDQINFHRYPFHTLRLPLVFELADSFASLSEQPLTLTIDREFSGVGVYIDITGYETHGYYFNNRIHQYASNMGNPLAKEKVVRTPQASIEVHYRKSANSTFLSLLLPLATVMTLTLFAPSLSSAAWDVRVGIPPTALLTLIFLQQGYREKLPELPYVTYLDTLYNICYMTNIILFGLFLWSSNEIHDGADEDKAALAARIDRIDRRFQVGLLIFLLLAVAANWFAISARHG